MKECCKEAKNVQNGTNLSEKPSTNTRKTDTPKRIALAGNPNVGKSTLFNTLTGAKQKAVNAPGTTIAVETGKWRGHTVIDLPGLISMYWISPDEEVATNALMHKESTLNPDVVVLVADAMHISRALYLLSQVKASGLPVIIGVTMSDLAGKHGITTDFQKLKEIAGVHEVVLLDARNGKGTDELFAAIESAPEKENYEPITDPKARAKEQSDQHFAWVVAAEEQLKLSQNTKQSFSDILDKVLLNRVAGPLIFLLLMLGVFELTTLVSNPIIDLIDGNLRDLLTVSASGFLPLLYNSVILETIITVLTFLPPMFFMFLSLTILESSGYMGRAAFVATRIMRFLGLDGRALLPLIIGFGCNLPAVTGTRILPDSLARKRLGYLIPFTLCSARLAIFVVLAHAFFPENSGLVVYLLYLISIALILVVGIFLKAITHAKTDQNPFIISLPPYQLPLIGPMFTSVFVKLWQFVKEAGKVIAIVITVLFFLQLTPTPGVVNDDGENASFGNIDHYEDSLYGATTQVIAPIFAPAGFGDWHFSSALISGFLAKEVVISSMSTSYNSDNGVHMNDPVEESTADEDAVDGNDDDTNALQSKLLATIESSSGGHSGPAGLALLVFILAYTPCVATVAGLKREFSGKFAARSVALSLAVAYLLATLIFQIGALIW